MLMKCLLPFFLCVLLLFSGTLAGQDGGTSKSDTNSKAKAKSERKGCK
jgi:hypothetical protein